MLKVGSRGPEVAKLQRLIGAVPDGIFGRKTRDLLSLYQARHHLRVTGMYVTPVTSNSFISPLEHIDYSDMFFRRKVPIIEVGVDHLVSNAELYGFNSDAHIAIAMGQVFAEVGASVTLEENLNYSCSALPKLFSVYRRNKALARKHGRCGGHVADKMSIANTAYGSHRLGLGNTEKGDGWKYRGRGVIQLTGRHNYQKVDSWLQTNNPNLANSMQIMDDPDVIASPEYAFVSFGVYWSMNKLERCVGKFNQKSCDKVTRKINRYTSSYKKRWVVAQQFMNLIKG